MEINQLLGYEGKNVVVTGAAGGMGSKAVELLVGLGAKVFAIVHEKNPQYPVEEIIRCDLSNKDNLEKIPSQLPENLYAIFFCHGNPCNPGDELLGQIVNYLAMKRIAELLLPRIEPGGVVANIASIAGLGWNSRYLKECQEIAELSCDETLAWYARHPDVIQRDAYSFSKACQLSYVKYNATSKEYLGRGVRLFGLAAGATKTAMTDHFARMMGTDGDLNEGREALESVLFYRMGRSGRWGRPEEQGWPLVLLGSKVFSYFSGQIVVMDNTSELFPELDHLYEATR